MSAGVGAGDGAPRAIIADDEPRLASYLAEKLATAWPELQIVGIAANGAEGVEAHRGP